MSFPKSGTLSYKLTWSHYYEILKADNELEINFYVKQCENGKLIMNIIKLSLNNYNLYMSTNNQWESRDDNSYQTK